MALCNSYRYCVLYTVYCDTDTIYTQANDMIIGVYNNIIIDVFLMQQRSGD